MEIPVGSGNISPKNTERTESSSLVRLRVAMANRKERYGLKRWYRKCAISA